MYCPTSILKPFFIIWSSIVLKGWMTTYSERDELKTWRQTVFTVHCMCLHLPTLTSSPDKRARKADEVLFPAQLGLSTLQPDESAKGAEFLVEVFFHTMLAVTPEFNKLVWHILQHNVNSRCTWHSATEHSSAESDSICRGKAWGNHTNRQLNTAPLQTDIFMLLMDVTYNMGISILPLFSQE